MTPRIGLAEAARLMRPGLNPATVNRWVLEGVRRPDGSRLKLKAVRVGSKWMTTVAWVSEFEEAHTGAFLGHPAAPTPRSPAEARRSSTAAETELERMGA